MPYLHLSTKNKQTGWGDSSTSKGLAVCKCEEPGPAGAVEANVVTHYRVTKQKGAP